MITTLFAQPGGRATKLDGDADLPRLLQEGKGVVWVDLDRAAEAEVKVLSDVFRFHQLAVEDCVAESSHPKINDYGEYVYLVMHGASRDAKGKFVTHELDLFCGRNFLVTYRQDDIPAIADLRKRCIEIEGLLARGADFLLHEILDDLADSFAVTIEALETQVDGIEGKLFKSPSVRLLAEIFAFKRDILRLKRVVFPQREVLNRLARAEFKVVSKEAAPYFRDVYDHVYRVADLAENFRDVVTSALETYLTVVSNRTNETVKILTVFSIILMTLALVAGIYGMNVPLPLAQRGYAIWLVIGFMGTIAGGLYLFFRGRKWV
ncbi:MAG: magnesium/cobalt transporter CorA [Planctomycetes bacterium]|nr:magnesium/cobalt transporter CorA [Planctomycetota bacterium]